MDSNIISRNILSPVEVSVTNLVHSSQIEYNNFTPLSPHFPLQELGHLIGKLPSISKELEQYYETTLQQLKVTLSFRISYITNIQLD